MGRHHSRAGIGARCGGGCPARANHAEGLDHAGERLRARRQRSRYRDQRVRGGVMNEITIPVTIHEDRRLVVDLPHDFPVGPVELIIRSRTPYQPEYPAQSVRERQRVRAKLLAAGILSTVKDDLEGINPLSPEELLKLGTLPPNARPTSDYINQERDARKL